MSEVTQHGADLPGNVANRRRSGFEVVGETDGRGR